MKLLLEGLRQRLMTIDRGVSTDLVFVFLAALGIRLFWAALTPPWMSPDEPQHFAYVAHLVENGEIPDPAVPDPRYQQHSPEYDQSCDLTLCSQLSGLGGGYGRLKHVPL